MIDFWATDPILFNLRNELMRGGGVDQISDVGEEDFDQRNAAEDIDLGLVDRAVPESKIMLTAVNSSGSPLVVGATMAPGSSCIGPAVTEKTEKVNAVMAEKVKFTVSVRGHQWSSARHVEETLQEFAAVIQVTVPQTSAVNSAKKKTSVVGPG